jgi:hypothetical protein
MPIKYFKLFNALPSFTEEYTAKNGNTYPNPFPNYGNTHGDQLNDIFDYRVQETPSDGTPSSGTDNLVAYIPVFWQSPSMTGMEETGLTDFSDYIATNYVFDNEISGKILLDFRGSPSWNIITGDGIIGQSNKSSTIFTQTVSAATAMLEHLNNTFPKIKFSFAGLPYIPQTVIYAPETNDFFTWQFSQVMSEGGYGTNTGVGSTNYWDNNHPKIGNLDEVMYSWANAPQDLKDWHLSNFTDSVSTILEKSGWICPDINPLYDHEGESREWYSIESKRNHTEDLIRLSKVYADNDVINNGSERKEVLPLVNNMYRSRFIGFYDDPTGRFLRGKKIEDSRTSSIVSFLDGYTGNKSYATDKFISEAMFKGGMIEPAASPYLSNTPINTIYGCDGFVYLDQIPFALTAAFSSDQSSGNLEYLQRRSRNFIGRESFGTPPSENLPIWSNNSYAQYQPISFEYDQNKIVVLSVSGNGLTTDTFNEHKYVMVKGSGETANYEILRWKQPDQRLTGGTLTISPYTEGVVVGVTGNTGEGFPSVGLTFYYYNTTSGGFANPDNIGRIAGVSYGGETSYISLFKFKRDVNIRDQIILDGKISITGPIGPNSKWDFTIVRNPEFDLFYNPPVTGSSLTKLSVPRLLDIPTVFEEPPRITDEDISGLNVKIRTMTITGNDLFPTESELYKQHEFYSKTYASDYMRFLSESVPIGSSNQTLMFNSNGNCVGVSGAELVLSNRWNNSYQCVGQEDTPPTLSDFSPLADNCCDYVPVLCCLPSPEGTQCRGSCSIVQRAQCERMGGTRVSTCEECLADDTLAGSCYINNICSSVIVGKCDCIRAGGEWYADFGLRLRLRIEGASISDFFDDVKYIKVYDPSTQAQIIYTVHPTGYSPLPPRGSIQEGHLNVFVNGVIPTPGSVSSTNDVNVNDLFIISEVVKNDGTTIVVGVLYSIKITAVSDIYFDRCAQNCSDCGVIPHLECFSIDTILWESSDCTCQVGVPLKIYSHKIKRNMFNGCCSDQCLSSNGCVFRSEVGLGGPPVPSSRRPSAISYSGGRCGCSSRSNFIGDVSQTQVVRDRGAAGLVNVQETSFVSKCIEIPDDTITNLERSFGATACVCSNTGIPIPPLNCQYRRISLGNSPMPCRAQFGTDIPISNNISGPKYSMSLTTRTIPEFLLSSEIPNQDKGELMNIFFGVNEFPQGITTVADIERFFYTRNDYPIRPLAKVSQNWRYYNSLYNENNQQINRASFPEINRRMDIHTINKIKLMNGADQFFRNHRYVPTSAVDITYNILTR